MIKDIDFTISGMHCASCAVRIEKKLRDYKGIHEASINLTTEKAVVKYNDNLVTQKEIFKIINDLGFKAEVNNKVTTNKNKKDNIKLIISILLSLPLLIIMLLEVFNIKTPDTLTSKYTQFLIATPIQFVIGWQFYKGAYISLKNGSANMDVLVVLGTSAAYFYSFVNTFFLTGPLYYETSAVLITLILLGKTLEERAKGKTSEAIKSLMNLQVKKAAVIKNGREASIPIEEVKKGDIIIVKSGEKIAVDGIIIDGYGTVDESMLTGESIPVDKTVGDEVFGSTINEQGYFKFKAAKVGKETALAQIIKIVEEAQSSKAPIQRIADVISGYFVPAVLIIAVLTFFMWYFILEPKGDNTVLTQALINFTAVLVIACPCSLGLAVPTSIMVGTGRGAEYGVLFKGGEYLEKAHKMTAIIFDKTGTITKGKPEVTEVYGVNNFDTKEITALSAGAEKASEHPLGKAIYNYAVEKDIDVPEPLNFKNLVGYGIEANIKNKKVLIGNLRLMKKYGIETNEIDFKLKNFQQEGKTPVIVSLEGEVAGLIAVSDAVKEEAKDVIKEIKKLGIQIWMITGDDKNTAAAAAEKVGIDNVIAEVLPEEKAKEVEKLKNKDHIVAMVGDGINDAPALVSADVGIAVGTGTDVAIEAADVTILRGNLKGIVDAVHLSRDTMKNIKQNLFWALFYNSLGIPAAVSGLLSPIIAGSAMAFSSVSVVLNALRLRKWQPK